MIMFDCNQISWRWQGGFCSNSWVWVLLAWGFEAKTITVIVK